MTAMFACRVLVVDDNPLFARVVLRLLAQWPGVEVVGTAACAEEARALAATLAPDVILLDVNLPGTTGLEVLPELRAAAPGARVIVMTLHDQLLYQSQAFARGAEAFISKSEAMEQLPEALRRCCVPIG